MKFALKTMLCVCFLVGASYAQKLGIVEDIKPGKCLSGFATGTTCQHMEVVCPGLNDMGVTVGTVTGTGTVKGSITLFTGSTGEPPSPSSYIDSYKGMGFTTYNIAWDPPGWAYVGPEENLVSTSCEAATLLNYLHSVAPSGAFCGQGISGGSAELGYALAIYGEDTLLDNVELLSGPVMANVEAGCITPAGPNITIVPTNGASFAEDPTYSAGYKTSLTETTGYSCAPKKPTSTTANNAWAAQSIVQTTSILNYPQTTIAGWVCNNGLNNSAAEGWEFYSALQSEYTLTSITGCTGPENVDTGTTPQGLNAETAIEQDMQTQCIGRH